MAGCDGMGNEEGKRIGKEGSLDGGKGLGVYFQYGWGRVGVYGGKDGDESVFLIDL